MALYAMGDTHLSLGTDKPMDVFGGGWTGYVDKLREGFAQVAPEDTVVVCGDISWGMGLEEARADACRLLQERVAAAFPATISEIDVTEGQVFATFDDYGHGGRDIRVRCQLRPGVER